MEPIRAQLAVRNLPQKWAARPANKGFKTAVTGARSRACAICPALAGAAILRPGPAVSGIHIS